MKNVIKFIEKYLEEPTEYFKNSFKVTCESFSNSTLGLWVIDGNRRDYPIITLDDEDLKYLYDKYLPFYHKQKLIEYSNIEKKKLEDIKDLEAKIDKIRNSPLFTKNTD